MIITKKSLPRRTLLRGLGTSLALPLLDAMVPSMTALAATPAKPVRRLGFVYVPMGATSRSGLRPRPTASRRTLAHPQIPRIGERPPDRRHQSRAAQCLSRHPRHVQRVVPLRRHRQVDGKHATTISPPRPIRSPPRASARPPACPRSNWRWTSSPPSASATTATPASIKTISPGRPPPRRFPPKPTPALPSNGSSEKAAPPPIAARN